MKLYIFNPDSDLALADFTEHYMPPSLIHQMASDLAVLPMWVAERGSGIMAVSAYNESFMEQMQELFDLPVSLVTFPELSSVTEGEVHPWGWNPTLRKFLLKMGMKEGGLPSLQQLKNYRQMAGRQQALQLLESFQNMEGCCGAGRCLTSVEACADYWRNQHNRCVYKSPWSGSGKGLLWCYSDFSPAVEGWCRHVLSAQGALIGMPIYNKVCDAALEFYATGDGSVQFAGYSLFTTNAKGAYLGNLLASDEEIECRLSAWVPVELLHRVRAHLCEWLPRLFAGYRGYLGVDVMVCQTDEGVYKLCPCVEVNLRMNMGLVARLFCDRYLDSHAVGQYKVEAFSTPEALQQAHTTDMKQYPLEVHAGKIRRGYLCLTPVTPQSRYRVAVYVEKIMS